MLPSRPALRSRAPYSREVAELERAVEEQSQILAELQQANESLRARETTLKQLCQVFGLVVECQAAQAGGESLRWVIEQNREVEKLLPWCQLGGSRPGDRSNCLWLLRLSLEKVKRQAHAEPMTLDEIVNDFLQVQRDTALILKDMDLTAPASEQAIQEAKLIKVIREYNVKSVRAHVYQPGLVFQAATLDLETREQLEPSPEYYTRLASSLKLDSSQQERIAAGWTFFKEMTDPLLAQQAQLREKLVELEGKMQESSTDSSRDPLAAMDLHGDGLRAQHQELATGVQLVTRKLAWITICFAYYTYGCFTWVQMVTCAINSHPYYMKVTPLAGVITQQWKTAQEAEQQQQQQQPGEEEEEHGTACASAQQREDQVQQRGAAVSPKKVLRLGRFSNSAGTVRAELGVQTSSSSSSSSSSNRSSVFGTVSHLCFRPRQMSQPCVSQLKKQQQQQQQEADAAASVRIECTVQPQQAQQALQQRHGQQQQQQQRLPRQELQQEQGGAAWQCVPNQQVLGAPQQPQHQQLVAGFQGGGGGDRSLAQLQSQQDLDAQLLLEEVRQLQEMRGESILRKQLASPGEHHQQWQQQQQHWKLGSQGQEPVKLAVALLDPDLDRQAALAMAMATADLGSPHHPTLAAAAAAPAPGAAGGMQGSGFNRGAHTRGYAVPLSQLGHPAAHGGAGGGGLELQPLPVGMAAAQVHSHGCSNGGPLAPGLGLPFSSPAGGWVPLEGQGLVAGGEGVRAGGSAAEAAAWGGGGTAAAAAEQAAAAAVERAPMTGCLSSTQWPGAAAGSWDDRWLLPAGRTGAAAARRSALRPFLRPLRAVVNEAGTSAGQQSPEELLLGETVGAKPDEAAQSAVAALGSGGAGLGLLPGYVE